LPGCGSTLKSSTPPPAPALSTASGNGDAPPPVVTRQIEGLVEAIPPAVAAGTFKVAGETITVGPATVYTSNDAPAGLNWVVVGAKVKVTATVTVTLTGTTLQATLVGITVPATVTLQGAISNFSGTATAFAFDLVGAHVTATSAATFEGDGTFADLKNGAIVAVTGDLRTDGVVAKTLNVTVEPPATDPDPAPEPEPEPNDPPPSSPGHSVDAKPLVGTMSGFTGTSASFSFDVNGTRVTGGTGTEYQAKTTFGDLKNGAKVQVWTERRGTVNFATRIHKTGK
jgi:hypothetical protein